LNCLSPRREYLAFKPNCREVVTRLSLLYGRQALDSVFARLEVPSPTLSSYAREHAPGEVSYPDPSDRISFWEALLCERTQLEDDSLPACYLSEFDQGLYAGLVGGKLRFLLDPESGRISSMTSPLISDISDFRNLKVDTNSTCYRNYLAQLELFAERADGRFGVSHLILIDSINFLFDLRGATNAYYDMIDSPEFVKEVISLAHEVNVLVQETFFEKVGLFMGGTFSNMGEWLPGKVVSESIDPFHLTAPRWFLDWGQAPVERIFDHFDGGLIHLHSNGEHLIPHVCRLRGLKALYLVDDRDAAPWAPRLNAVDRMRGDVPLIINIAYGAFRTGLEQHTLTTNTLYRVWGVPDVRTANELMEQVRRYRG